VPRPEVDREFRVCWSNRRVLQGFVCLRVVACGDRKDVLQFTRMLHCRRQCNMRVNCKKDYSWGGYVTRLRWVVIEP